MRRDHRSAVGAVVAQLGESLTTAELIEKTLAALAELVPADVVLYNEVSTIDGRTHGATWPRSWMADRADLLPVFERWSHQNPTVQHALESTGAVRWSDGDIQAFRSTELFQQFMTPAGVAHQLVFALPPRAAVVRGFVFNRGECDFDDDEVAICNEISPYLSVLFELMAQRTASVVSALTSSPSRTAVVVDRSGELVVGQSDGPGIGSGELIPEVRAWIRGVFAEPDVLLHATSFEGEIVGGSGEALSLQLISDPVGSHVLTVECIDRAFDTRQLAGLTPRQADVLRALADGGTNDQIARRLGISTETVKKHLTAAYRALGVADRASALARISAS